MTRIGVTGAKGRLGRELVRWGCIPIDADVTDLFALESAVKNVEVGTIVHCAAYTDVDGCESDPLRAAKVNMHGVRVLSLAFPGKIVYISTDYIFDGTAGPYVEYSSPNPINVYGWSKLGGELVLKSYQNDSNLVIRTTVLFGTDGDDFVGYVVGKLLAGKPIYLPDNLYGSPTYIPHLAEDILIAVEKGVSGVLNLAGSPAMSRYHFGLWIAEAAGISTDFVRRGGPSLDKAPRPLMAGLVVNKARRLGFPCRNPYSMLGPLLDRHRKAERQ